LSIRPADASGAPTTSSLNFSAGDIIPNSVTVQVPTSGADIGKIEITYNAFEQAGPTTEILVDLVGYTKNAGLASLQAQVNELQAIVSAATAPGAVGQEEIGTGAVGTSELAANSVNSSHVVDNSLTAADLQAEAVGLSELKAEIVDNHLIPANPGNTVAFNGGCTGPISIPVGGTVVDSRTLVIGAVQTTDLATPEWTVEGLVSTAPGEALVQICNYTSVDGAPQPGFQISVIVLGP
jgi:hypothetical protein